jgi:hypothetical protein
MRERIILIGNASFAVRKEDDFGLGAFRRGENGDEFPRRDHGGVLHHDDHGSVERSRSASAPRAATCDGNAFDLGGLG